MIIYCMKCSSQLDPFFNYCPFCGYDAPRGTIMPDAEPLVIKDGIYCVHCSRLNLKDALFCADCGKHLYEKPASDVLNCPNCAKLNKKEAVFCYHCSTHLDDWFAMRGKIARDLGYRGSFTLHETLNDLYYHFMRMEKVTFGRNVDNTIVMPSGWVSGRHCILDLKEKKLIDEVSTNGTFINRKSERIRKQPLSLVHEFNIAGVFTFTLLKKQDLFITRLTAILDQEGLKREGRLDHFDEMRNHYFILIGGEGKLDIRKMDGEILGASDDMMEFFSVSVQEDGYFFTDPDRDLKDKLLLRKFNNLPVNWQFDFGE